MSLWTRIFPHIALMLRRLQWPPGWHPRVGGGLTSPRGFGLFSLSVATGELRRLAKPPPEAWSGDLAPAVSPDGRTLAFTRSLTRANSEIYLLPLDDRSAASGEPRLLTSEDRASAQPAWTPDGKAIVFASGSRGSASSSSPMMIPASASGEKAVRIPVGEGGESPAISNQGRLVYMRWVRDENIWRLSLPGGTAERFILSTRRDVEPCFSADGKQIAFTSDRTGTNEVWLCDADGSNPMQENTLERAGFPGTFRARVPLILAR